MSAERSVPELAREGRRAFTFRGVEVHCYHAAGTVADSRLSESDPTGHVPWSAMPLLALFLTSDEGTQLVRGKRVVELGSGVGVPGMLAAAVGARRVVMSDFNEEVLQSLRRTAAEAGCGRVEVLPLTWGRGAGLPEGLPPGEWDVVIGSDIVYSEGSIGALRSPPPPRSQDCSLGKWEQSGRHVPVGPR
mmetsp:Transcript_13806/g.43706  ORF Transcript_13806/g.43706 Transcript_13806/m.43706 type:complete len:190 (+) Transcript_13806:119-688(+)